MIKLSPNCLHDYMFVGWMIADNGFILERDWSSPSLGYFVVTVLLTRFQKPLLVLYYLLVRSMRQKRGSSSSTSPCASLRDAYHNCFNRSPSTKHLFPSLLLLFISLQTLFPLSSLTRWYAERFMKGQWDKEECVSEWEKYRACLSVGSITSLKYLSNVPR